MRDASTLSMHSALKANAELVRKIASQKLGVDASYDEAGVRWLDDFLNRQRQHGTAESKEKLPQTLGSFLGECIIGTYGGLWVFDETLQSWSVSFSDGNCVYPFSKVSKQLESGDGESVLSLFTAIPLVFGPRLKQSAATEIQKKSWWRLW